MKYQTKSIVVDAIQYDGSNDREIDIWGTPFSSEFITTVFPTLEDEVSVMKVVTRSGIATAVSGDWIIRGFKGEYYPCKPDIFEIIYEAVRA